MSKDKKKTKAITILRCKENGCTDVIKIHPVNSGTYTLYPASLDEAKEQRRYLYTSQIMFDKRQIWEAYLYSDKNGEAWILERKGMLIRMTQKNFREFFGDEYEVWDITAKAKGVLK